VEETTQKEEKATTTSKSNTSVVEYAKNYLGCKYVSATMSPGCNSSFDTATPSFICPFDDLLNDTPKFLYTYDVHAANPRQGVVITSLSSSYYSKRYVGARRVK